jgi:hypothetical protein
VPIDSEYTPEQLEYFREVNELINDRYYPLAEDARRTGQTMTSDFISHLVKVEVCAELEELAQVCAAPHPRIVDALPEAERVSHA